MSTKATKEQQQEKIDEVIGTAMVLGGGALLAGLGKLFFGNNKNSPEQLAQLRASVVTVRKHLTNIRNSYNAAYEQYGLFKPITTKLNAFWKQTEAAYAANDPKKLKQAVQQAATVLAYATTFANLSEDVSNLILSHKDDINSGNPAIKEPVFKMLHGMITRELTAANLDKLGTVGRQLALISPNLKLLPAPPGLTPKDFADDYIEELKTEIAKSEKDRKENAAKNDQAKEKETSQDQPPRPQTDSAQVQSDQVERQRLTNLTANQLRANYVGAVMESHKKLNEEVKKLHLESLKEYKSVFKESLKITLAEQANRQAGIDKFLAASASVAKGINQAQRSAASTPTAQTTSQQAPAGQLTPDQFKRVQTMLQSVTSVMGRLTPEQKKRFSGLLGQLKSVIG